MDTDLRSKLPLIEVKEITYAEALRLLTKQIEIAQEPKVEPECFPYGVQVVKGVVRR